VRNYTLRGLDRKGAMSVRVGFGLVGEDSRGRRSIWWGQATEKMGGKGLLVRFER